MLRFALLRSFHAFAVAATAFVAVFFALRATPGGPAVAMLGQRATAEEVARVDKQYGWDRPAPVQLANYLWR
ncbi:MAG: ABC transporter permease, partial [Planctomycetia bacterium]